MDVIHKYSKNYYIVHLITRQDKEKQKNHDWSKKLVGHVDSEYLISPEIMLKWKQKFFDPIINTYVKNHIEHKIKSILINSFNDFVKLLILFIEIFFFEFLDIISI